MNIDIYCPQMKLWKGNAFTSMCQEFCPQGVGGVHPLGRHPPPQQMATAADGTQPTGMHSCTKL